MNIIMSSNKGMAWNKYFFGSSLYRNDTLYFDSKYDLIDNIFIRVLYRVCNVRVIRDVRIIKKINWFKYFSNLNSKNVNRLFVFNWERLSFDEKFHEYLKYNNRNIKIYLILTSTFELSKKYLDTLNISFNHFKGMFVQIFTFDEKDSIKYGFKLLPLLYSNLDMVENTTKYDLCYIGSAKDRLIEIQTVFYDLTMAGLKCKFYVNGVRNNQNKLYRIVYNKRIPYKKSLHLSNSSRCILELIEKNQTNSTTRLCEAVVLNKKLITNNINIITNELYSPDYIYVLGYNTSSLVDFITDKTTVDNSKYKAILLSRELMQIAEKIETSQNE